MTFETVKNIVVETLQCDADEVTMETNIAEDLNADSLDIVELNMAIETEFGMSISDEELVNLKTVGDIVGYIDAKKGA